MSLISSVYGNPNLTRRKKPKAQAIPSMGKLRAQAQFADDRRKLVAMVRAAGFHECKPDASMRSMRQYLKEQQKG